MNPYTTGRLAAARHQELLAEATRYRRHRRPGQQARARNARADRLHRGSVAVRAWIDASQL